jgi:hypothetical protein
VVDIAVHSLPAGCARDRDVAVDETQLRLRPKYVLDNTHHVHIGVEFASQPFGCQGWHHADVLGGFTLVPLLELLADVDTCVLNDLVVQTVYEFLVDGVLENYKAIAMIVVQALLDGLRPGDARFPLSVRKTDDNWVFATLIDLWEQGTFEVRFGHVVVHLEVLAVISLPLGCQVIDSCQSHVLDGARSLNCVGIDTKSTNSNRQCRLMLLLTNSTDVGLLHPSAWGQGDCED